MLFGVVIFLIIFWVWYINFNPPEAIFVDYDKYKHKIKTGDLILFHAFDQFNATITASYYGHIGIVVEIAGKLMMFEVTGLRNSYNPVSKKELILTDLESRIKIYKGMCYIKSLERPLTTEQYNKLLYFIDKSKNIYEYRYDVYYNGFEKMAGGVYNFSTNCGELVLQALYYIGLLKKEDIFAPYFNSLWKSCHIAELICNKYYLPKLIKYSYIPVNYLDQTSAMIL